MEEKDVMFYYFMLLFFADSRSTN